MENLIVCLNAVLPIFITMAIGYVARLMGILKREDVLKFNKIGFRVFIPAMVFYNIYSSDFSAKLNMKLILLAVVGIFAIVAITSLIAVRFISEPSVRGVAIQGCYRSNFVIIGLPMAMSLLGYGDLSAVTILLAIVIPIFNALAVIILSVNNGEKPDLKQTFINILKNPLIIGTALGIICVLVKLKLPTAVEKVVHDMAGVASPLLIFLLGAFFEFKNLSHKAAVLAFTCFTRLVAVPGVILTVGYLLGFRGVEFVALIGVFASPSATTSFPMAQQMGGDATLAGNIVVLSSALCSFTLFVWCFLFKSIGAF